MDNKSREKLFADRRVDRAVDYVSDRWFPVNPELLERIKGDLSEGVYDNDIPALFSDVRQDFSLFLYCLRELSIMLRAIGAELPPNPHDLFVGAGIERLKEILSIDELAVSHHRLKSITPSQQSRLEEALLSASTAQVLASIHHLDGNTCFSAALLRQLGLTLIAWNYPNVYERAVQSLAETGDLDVAITTILGYSPSLLAVRILEHWGLHEDLLAAIEPLEADWFESEALVGATAAPTFASICTVAEALARANHPDVYPSAERDWARAESVISRQLGPDGLRVIRTIFLESCAGYVGVIRSIFRGGTMLDPEYRQFSYRHTGLVQRNPYIDQCRPHLAKRLTSFYEDIARSTEISQQQLLTLAQEIIPAAGFSGGVVYTIEPTMLRLIPQLTFGKPLIQSNEWVDTQVLSEPVARAFESITPITNEYLIDGNRLVSIAGVLGYSQRVGVVYLEIPRQSFVQSSAAFLTHFKAITQSFNECLKLG
ncbi:MAG: hypothetical protein RL417_380 [Pseudomonadota bacterium]|jgi:hypothetical protein